MNRKTADSEEPAAFAVRLFLRGLLGEGDVGGLHALGATDGVELDALAFLKGAEAIGLDGGVMDEQIGAVVVRGDEAEAFSVVEPLNGTGSHNVAIPVWEIELSIPENGPAAESRNLQTGDHTGAHAKDVIAPKENASFPCAGVWCGELERT